MVASVNRSLHPAVAGERSDEGQWSLMARVWKKTASPLRPSDEDLGFLRKAAAAFETTAGRPPRVLIMGVTPEVYHLPWPEGSVVKAIDWTPEMVDYVWPGSREHVFLCDWRQMALPPGSVDIVTCDGGIHLLDCPVGQRTTCRRLASVVAPGGLFIARMFVPPAVRETPEEVLEDLFAGRIPDLNCLKLRLGMAVQDNPAEGVALRRVWQILRDATADWPALAERLGWSLDHLLVIDTYRDTETRYYFIGVSELTANLCRQDGAFEHVRTETPGYAMGARCPTVIYRRTVR